MHEYEVQLSVSVLKLTFTTIMIMKFFLAHAWQTTHNKGKVLNVYKGSTIIGLISIEVNNITITKRGTQAKKGTLIKQKAP